MLEQISGGSSDTSDGNSAASTGLKKKGVTIQRRKYGFDDGDEDDDDSDLL
jgi:hypothetical protein